MGSSPTLGTINMTPNFIKLKRKFILPEYVPTELHYMFSPGKDYLTYKRDYDDVRKYVLGMWGVEDQEKLKALVIDIIPERYRDRFYIQCSRIPHGSMAHIDPDRKCAINFYVSTQGCITKTFLPKGTDIGGKWKAKADFIYLQNEVEEIGSFVAEDGDAYVLNTWAPHQVVTTQAVTDRKMLCLSSRYSYEEVVEMLAETGSI